MEEKNGRADEEIHAVIRPFTSIIPHRLRKPTNFINKNNLQQTNKNKSSKTHAAMSTSTSITPESVEQISTQKIDKIKWKNNKKKKNKHKLTKPCRHLRPYISRENPTPKTIDKIKWKKKIKQKHTRPCRRLHPSHPHRLRKCPPKKLTK